MIINILDNFFVFLGTVFFVDDKGHTTTSFAVDGGVKTLLYYEGRDILVTVTENMMLTQHSISFDGNTNEIMKVNLHGFIANGGQHYLLYPCCPL